jgi:hypothetical protein
MAVGDEGFILDGFNLNDGNGSLVLEALEFIQAAKKPQWAENSSADGDLLVEEAHYTNSYFTHKVRFIGEDMDEALALMGQLTDKLQKAERMAARGGIPMLWTPAELSTTYTWWPLLGEYTEIPITPTGDLAGWFLALPVVSFKLTCRPFGYKPERVAVAPVQSALPVQAVLIPDVGGDVAAEARAILTDKAGQDRRHLEWGLDQVDGEQATNLITNPKSAIDATSWAGVSLAAGPTRVLPEFPLAELNADTAIEAKGNADGDYLYHPVTVVNGTTYRFSVYAQLSALTATGIRAVVYNAAGAAKKATGEVTLSAIDASGWTRLDVSFKADASATWRVGLEQVGAGATTFAATAAMAEASANLTPYFDGDVAHAGWTGTRHASTSNRLADTLITATKLVTTGFGGTATTRAGAYGEEKVVRATAVGMPVTMCSTGDIAHVGVFKGKPRVYAISTDARLRVSYRVGDGPFYSLPWQAPPVINAWVELDLGELTLDRLLRGPQRAEIRIDVKSVGANTPVDVNYLDLLPTLKGWGKARGLSSDEVTNLLAYDEFDQVAGTLTGGYTTNPITAITAANPGVITSTAHGLSNGDQVWIEGIVGTMGEVLRGLFTVAGVTTNTFNVGVSTVGKGYTSGGKISKSGKTLPFPTAAKWFGIGSTNDGSINTTAHTLERTAVSDPGLDAGGRFFIAGMSAVATVVAQANFKASGSLGAALDLATNGSFKFRYGKVVRYKDINNWLMAVLTNPTLPQGFFPSVGGSAGTMTLWPIKCVAGVVTIMKPAGPVGSWASGVAPGADATVAISVDAAGRYRLWSAPAGAALGTPRMEGQDNDLKTGGALASGLVGDYDVWVSANACTRTIDKVNAAVPSPAGRVCYSNRSLEIRSDITLRQDADGIHWGPPNFVRDSLLYIPPKGDNDQVARLITKLRRGDLDLEADTDVTDNQELTVRIAERVLVPR